MNNREFAADRNSKKNKKLNRTIYTLTEAEFVFVVIHFGFSEIIDSEIFYVFQDLNSVSAFN